MGGCVVDLASYNGCSIKISLCWRSSLLSALKAARWYILLTLLLFLFFLVAYLPANFAWQQLKGNVGPLSVNNTRINISQVQGTIWDGSVDVTAQAISASVKWSIQPLSLVSGSLVTSIALKTDAGSDLQAVLDISSSQAIVSKLSGQLELLELAPYLKPQRVEAKGVLGIYDLSFDVDTELKKVNQAEGRLLWKNAYVSYPGPRKQQSVTLPEIAGRLMSDDKGINLNVQSAQDGSLLGSLFVMNQGWAGVKVRKRTVDLVGQTWVGKQQPDDVIFQIREKVW